MATEEINYRVDIKQADGDWVPWAYAYSDLERAKQEELNARELPYETVRDARIVEVRRTWTEAVLGVAAASLDILSREEI